MLNELGPNIWSLDGPEVIFAGAAMHTRMTIVRLSSGGLWLHSPIQRSEQVQAEVSKLGGPVVALVAPNKYHHLYIGAWQTAFPEAAVYAEPQLRRKVAALATAEELTNNPPDSYAADIDQVLFEGNPLFQEAVFFHKQSRTLVLTDLMLNLKTDRVKFLPRLFLKFEGAVFPNGGVLRLHRWFTLDRAKARQALAKIQAWEPEQITFCHGVPFLEDAGEVIRNQFRWLL